MELRAGLPQVVGAGRCPASLGKNQVLSFLLLMVLLVWNWLEALEPRNFWGGTYITTTQLGKESGDSASVSGVKDGSSGVVFSCRIHFFLPHRKAGGGICEGCGLMAVGAGHPSPGCWVQAGICWDSSGRGSPCSEWADAHREPNPLGAPQITP